MQIDKKRLKLDGTEMNGHPTGKPAFSVQRFYSSSSTAPRRRSRRLRDLDSGSESDSKTSKYDYDGSTDDDQPKRPERHIYLRRHIIDDDEEEEDESSKEKTDEQCGGEDEEDVTSESKDDTTQDKIIREKESKSKDTMDEHNSFLNDSHDSNIDASSEKSGPSEPATEPKISSEKIKVSLTESTEKNDELDEEDKKPTNVDFRSRKPPPLERVSPKGDPLGLDSLGFGALASCFSNNERENTYRSEHSSNSTQSARSSLRPNDNFSSSDRLDLQGSPNSYQNAKSRFGTLPPSYDQSSTFANYLAYNQTNYSSSGSPLDVYSGTPSSRQSFSELNYPTNRQYAGFSQSKKDTSSFSQPPPYTSSLSSYSPQYPSNDMTSRSSYYPTSSPSYSLPTKNPYSQGYFPDNPFSTGMFYGNAGTTMGQRGVKSWPSHKSTSPSSHYPTSGVGQSRTEI